MALGKNRSVFAILMSVVAMTAFFIVSEVLTINSKGFVVLILGKSECYLTSSGWTSLNWEMSDAILEVYPGKGVFVVKDSFAVSYEITSNLETENGKGGVTKKYECKDSNGVNCIVGVFRPSAERDGGLFMVFYPLCRKYYAFEGWNNDD
jgi:hypothetical protein